MFVSVDIVEILASMSASKYKKAISRDQSYLKVSAFRC